MGPTDYLREMADGTFKQVNPFTGTQVWTVPGRGDRPLGLTAVAPKPLDEAARTSACAFCSDRYVQTPPEKSRVSLTAGRWVSQHGLPLGAVLSSLAEFRRIPNLYEILPLEYWRANYDYRIRAADRARMTAYLADPAGREHVLELLTTKVRADQRDGLSDDALLERDASAFFGGTHDVIVARRHYADEASNDSQLASSGTLNVDEHHQYVAFTIDAIRDLYERNPHAQYVAAFQNWLKPAGASFDHLHKQVVAIDERGVQVELELGRARVNPQIYNEAGVDYAREHNLIIAENDHAIAFAGFGHRYPTLELFSRSEHCAPWDHAAQEIRGMSDLLHALHSAGGPDVPCNEEWHHQPPGVDVAMPWRIMIKWRVSTLAGFEGGTKIYLNTISPTALRERVVTRLRELRADGAIAADIRIGDDANVEQSPLRYR
ncbi:DUF4921 family protein [Cumulibacter soli]|uniref:DUF4921 family protein n=1 Tax=Cumulibacter soli TaxID=2546344 RepID=UPI001ABB7245|nr:DUF4921 family protein [Cumulibacter soli]